MADQRLLDRPNYRAAWYEHLDRVLTRPQLAGIGISGCVGAGIFVTSGNLIAVTGSLGGVLSYVIAGGITACILYTLTEMVTCRPLTGTLIDLPHKFLDPAAGFAVGASYILSNICSMAILNAQSAELTALLKNNPKKHNVETEIGINVFFIALTTISHCVGVKFYGGLERIIMWFKLSLFVLCCILMVIVNIGAVGPRSTEFQSNYTSYAFVPGWKPTGFESTTVPDLKSSGVNDVNLGIPGSGGRLFAFLTAVTLAMFSCKGGEIVAMTAGEARDPWRDVPLAMSFVYIVPLSLYPLTLLSAGANVNYADPNLPRLWAMKKGGMSLSPFVIAVQSSSLHGLPRVLNLFFIMSAYTAANTALYAASRAVFTLAQTYMPVKLANIFGRTNNGHTPLASILLCSAFGFLSLIGLSKYTYSQPRLTLSELYTGIMASINITLMLTFLRFKKGLDIMEKRGLLERDSDLYITRLFKSRWQPLPAYIAIVGCTFVIVWSGIPPLYILIARDQLKSTSTMKTQIALVFDVIGYYLGPIIFVSFYLTYKYITPRSFRVDLRDITSSHYVLDDMHFSEQSNPCLVRHTPSITNMLQSAASAIELESGWDTGSHQNAGVRADWHKPHGSSFTQRELELNPEMLDEIEAQRARIEERQRIQEILARRPKRWENGFWREMWSFVVVQEKEKSKRSDSGALGGIPYSNHQGA